MATRKSDADGRGSARYRGRSSLGEASSIGWKGGLPIGSSNGSSDRQAGPGGGDGLGVSASGFALGSANPTVDRQSGLYASNIARTVPREDRCVDVPTPRSDGVAFKFVTGD
jgi:hypothetical protein